MQDFLVCLRLEYGLFANNERLYNHDFHLYLATYKKRSSTYFPAFQAHEGEVSFATDSRRLVLS